MKVTLIQLDIEWGSPDENIRRVESLMDSEPNSDLYVLPEMWSTGFVVIPDNVVENEANSVALQWMRKEARKRNCAISGSIAINIEGSYRNRHYFIDGHTGLEQYYDKHHLFSYGGESKYYKPGNEHTIVNYNGFSFLLLTCYDLRFPLWIRYADSLKYDTIICVANWPEKRQNAWQSLIRARAIENQAFFIGCNRVGNDPISHYCGDSAIINPNGFTMKSCQPNTEEAVSCDLNIDEVRKIRLKYRFLDDLDSY